nr:hypothetical protein [Mariniflexile sp. KMM 9835]MDQ8211342.1 hypothetical protein [Mariniflexile sp. KMM 9835]
MFFSFIIICVSYYFTRTSSVLLISSALLISTILMSKRTFFNKLLISFGLGLALFILVIFVFYPSMLLPENWKQMQTWEFRSNLFSRIHNNAFKILEIKKEGFWFGGLNSAEDNLFVNYWAAFGVFGVLYFVFLSFKMAFKNYKISIRVTLFMISIILLGQLEQILYSTSFISILYFYYLITGNDKVYLVKIIKVRWQKKRE